MKRQVFYSFHYEKDVFRVQQIRNMGIVDGTQELSTNQWEEVKRKGNDNIKRWINENMKYRSCLVVLIGSETASRQWVKYEIKHAWDSGKGIVGIYIHNLVDTRTQSRSKKGDNPFDNIYVNVGGREIKLSRIVESYAPSYSNAYNDIKNNIANLVENAIKIREKY
jgi:hypothetical protein